MRCVAIEVMDNNSNKFLSHISMVLGIEQSLVTNVFEVLGFNPQSEDNMCHCHAYDLLNHT